jgi:RNA polymerase sigma factor (sigma-70 family)
MSLMDSLTRRTGPSSLDHASHICASVRSCAVRATPPRPAPPSTMAIKSAPDVESAEGPTDTELMGVIRHGDLAAFSILYMRHRPAAYNAARRLSGCPSDVDDYVAEAFVRVFAALRAGKGPDSEFRAYLLTAVRHVAYDKTRRERKIELAEEVGEVSGVPTELVTMPFTDTAVASLERRLAAEAFDRLSDRWQVVLWHTEIEGRKPAQLAPILGLTANGVSALAYRARESLCTAYLQAQVKDSDVANSCKATVARLGQWTRAGLGKREHGQVEAHLSQCSNCRNRVCELAADNPSLFRQRDKSHSSNSSERS